MLERVRIRPVSTIREIVGANEFERLRYRARKVIN